MPEKLRALAMLIVSTVRVDPPRAVATVLLVVLESVSGIAVALALKALVDAIVSLDSGAAARAAFVMALLVAAQRLTAAPVTTVSQTLKERTGNDIERRLIDMATAIPGIDLFERPELLDELELLRNERWKIQEALYSLVENLGIVIQSVAAAALLARVDPLLGLLPAFILPSIATTAAKNRKRVAFEERTAERRRIARKLRDLAVTPAAGMELRLFGLSGAVRGRFAELNASVERERLGTELRASGLQAIGDAAFAMGKFGAVVLLAVRAVRGQASVADVVMGVTLVDRLATQVEGAVHGVSWLLETMTTVGRFLRVRDAAAASALLASSMPPAQLRDAIRFEDVSFRYPGIDHVVLSGVDLDLPAGSTVAIVGDNGAGKSTLVKLLCRFYEPSSGRITVDGVDLASIDPVDWRERVSGAFQDFARFQLVLRESVGVGDVTRMHDPAAVRAALERAGALELVETVGLATRLGTLFEGGAELSSGQWQKVALGRAMMRTEPLLVVLDEPTAALDAATEHALFERYARIAKDAAARTGAITVLVSHRFSTVRMADRIVVVDEGRVIEQGTHQELMRRGGTYAELYALQARGYA